MTHSRRPLIAGNWKMNGLTDEVMDLATGLVTRMTKMPNAPFDMLLCPPFTAIRMVAEVLAGRLMIGGQDCHAAEKGAHTGDVSAAMLADAGCTFVIVGHSERRTDHGETNAVVRNKAKAALAAGLHVIICIGETEAKRDAGATMDVVRSQLSGSVPGGASSDNTVIAYEPVWAIGTGRVATPAQAQEVHAEIRTWLAVRLGDEQASQIRVLYGGSMKPDNAAELLALMDVDGGLIGGASLKVEDFWAIAQNCIS